MPAAGYPRRWHSPPIALISPPAFETLKKCQSGIYRAVPVPPALLDALDLVHGIRELHVAAKSRQSVA
jgi:hypothetical protein